MKFIYRDGREWEPTDLDIESWQSLYQFNVQHELAKAAEWTRANPPKRPQKSMMRFVCNWLNRCDDRHKPEGYAHPKAFKRESVRSVIPDGEAKAALEILEGIQRTLPKW